MLVRRAVAELVKTAGNASLRLYDRNQAVYDKLRYGVKVKLGAGEQTTTVWPIDWDHPERNRFAIAEEVTVRGATQRAHTKRPDIVLYVNGIALIAQRRQGAIEYQHYLEKIVTLTRQAKNGLHAGAYPKSLDSPAKRALFDNLDKEEGAALAADLAIRASLQDGWRTNKMKTRKVWLAIRAVVAGDDERVDRVVALAKSQNDY